MNVHVHVDIIGLDGRHTDIEYCCGSDEPYRRDDFIHGNMVGRVHDSLSLSRINVLSAQLEQLKRLKHDLTWSMQDARLDERASVISQFFGDARSRGLLVEYNLRITNRLIRSTYANVRLPKPNMNPGDILDDGTFVVSADGLGRGVMMNAKGIISKDVTTYSVHCTLPYSLGYVNFTVECTDEK